MTLPPSGHEGSGQDALGWQMHRAISRAGVGRTSWCCTPFENERFDHTSRLGNPSASFLPSFFCRGPGSIGAAAPSRLPGAVSHCQSSEPGRTPTCPPSSRASPFWCWPGREPLSFLGAAMLVALGQWLSLEVILPPGVVWPCPVMLWWSQLGVGAPGVYWREARGASGRPRHRTAPLSAGGGRGLLWAPRRLGVLDRASVRGAVAWLVTQPGGGAVRRRPGRAAGRQAQGAPASGGMVVGGTCAAALRMARGRTGGPLPAPGQGGQAPPSDTACL